MGPEHKVVAISARVGNPLARTASASRDRYRPGMRS